MTTTEETVGTAPVQYVPMHPHPSDTIMGLSPTTGLDWTFPVVRWMMCERRRQLLSPHPLRFLLSWPLLKMLVLENVA